MQSAKQEAQCDRQSEGSKMQPVSVQESLLVAFSPNLEYLATATRDGRLKAFDTGKCSPKQLGLALRWCSYVSLDTNSKRVILIAANCNAPPYFGG